MPESKDPRRSRDEGVVRASSQYLGHGMAIAASVALFGWVGSWVGRRIGAEDGLTLVGMLFGGAAGFYSMYLQLVVRPREEAKGSGDAGSPEDRGPPGGSGRT